MPPDEATAAVWDNRSPDAVAEDVSIVLSQKERRFVDGIWKVPMKTTGLFTPFMCRSLTRRSLPVPRGVG